MGLALTILLFCFVVLLGVTSCGDRAGGPGGKKGDELETSATSAVSPWHDISGATYVGAKSCQSCHEAEFSDWIQSDHHRAMQAATVETVRGDFNDTSFEHFGHSWRFFRKGEEYWVNAEDEKGEPRDFKIEYTFGHEPLQQYLVPFPGGRYQALQVCWDTRPAEEGGQRWFHLYPEEEIPPDDILHWTGKGVLPPRCCLPNSGEPEETHAIH